MDNRRESLTTHFLEVPKGLTKTGSSSQTNSTSQNQQSSTQAAGSGIDGVLGDLTRLYKLALLHNAKKGNESGIKGKVSQQDFEISSLIQWNSFYKANTQGSNLSLDANYQSLKNDCHTLKTSGSNERNTEAMSQSSRNELTDYQTEPAVITLEFHMLKLNTCTPKKRFFHSY
eukprot:TRINITY_DN5302_c0_g1_i2.p1 TRINITY_DN5302_c0_g1~~TRINITY_DN5302_c0_g1_i2.p1  ORF type:complete len:173 (+),score=20.92 TRINITY_DN5302_c0_g1_i2:209-727(+)